MLSAYSLSYLISISAAVSAKACGLCALYSAPRARQQLARVAAVCVRSMSFSIHFYQTRPHRHACANRQRRNRSGLASQRVAAPPAPSPRASNRRTLHTTHNSTAWRLRRHHCRQSSLRRKSVWALPLRRAQSGSRTTRHARCAPARRATATVARGPPCDSVARGLVLSHLSALAARETKTRQRSSRGHLLHHAGTAGAVGVAQAATRRVVARPSPLRSRLSRSAALPRHERAASSRRRESGDYTPGRRSATAPAVPW